MKGIIIYENDLGSINAVKLKHTSFCCKSIEMDITDTLEGTPIKCESANCNKDDTYDFETGALIALMKMCGVEKVKKAAKETFFDVAENAVNEYEEEINALKEEIEKLKKEKEQIIVAKSVLNNKLIEENSNLSYIKSCNESTIESLENTRDLLINKNNELIEENKKLKSDKDKSWKNYQRNIQKKQDRINELERAYKASNDDKAKLVEYYQREIKKLEAENEKLKLDCEKLQHGYNDMIYCGGRRIGKQYKALVEMFKKLDQKKVDAAYKEAYDKRIAQPIWQKEVFKQIHKDQLASLLEAGKYLYKIPTKREEMWEKIFALHKESDIIIKVKKEDVNTFLHEIENKIPEITWLSTVKIFETKYTIGDIYEALKTCDVIYFRLHKANVLTYSSDPHIYPYRELKPIDYLPPMRWDLFKKGRIVVGVRNNNELVEFRKEVERNTGIKNIPMCPTNLCLFYSFDKDDYKIILETIGEPNSAKINGHKVYYWEDVR